MEPMMMGTPLTQQDIAEWIESMQAMLTGVQVGVRYVYLDTTVIRADAPQICIEGAHARHVAPYVPHVAALDDRRVLELTLSSRRYWLDNAINPIPDSESDRAPEPRDRVLH
jgi:hypothetical protein